MRYTTHTVHNVPQSKISVKSKGSSLSKSHHQINLPNYMMLYEPENNKALILITTKMVDIGLFTDYLLCASNFLCIILLNPQSNTMH